MAPEPEFKPDPTIGPLLTDAMICEKVLEEKDGVKSAIRIIDQVNRTAVAPSPSQTMEPFDYPLSLLLRFKAGAARGTYKIDVRIVRPSNETAGTMSHPIHFPGPDDAGTDVVVNIMMRIDEAGTWWFEISVNDNRWMRIPLRVVYLPQQIKLPGASGAQS